MPGHRINIVFLLSYDYAFIKHSLPFVYDEADEIIISVDINRVSWAGNKYNFDESIIGWIKIFDRHNKIRIYEDNFFVAANTTMQNETRQRQLSANQFTKPGWIVQLDVDEYFLNFNLFADYLKKQQFYLQQPEKKPVNISVYGVNLFKKNEKGYFVVSKPLISVRAVTNFPSYQKARATSSYTIFTSFVIIHDTWARSEEEILLKINNWGHKDDFDTNAYFDKWKNLTEYNYKEYKNFNPVKPYSDLGELKFVKANNLTELLQNIVIPKPGKLKLLIKNTRQKLKRIWR